MLRKKWICLLLIWRMIYSTSNTRESYWFYKSLDLLNTNVTFIVIVWNKLLKITPCALNSWVIQLFKASSCLEMYLSVSLILMKTMLKLSIDGKIFKGEFQNIISRSTISEKMFSLGLSLIWQVLIDRNNFIN